MSNEKDKKLWLLIAISCDECKSYKAALYDYKPTEDDRQNIKKAAGGMFCIGTYIHEIAINGEYVDLYWD